MSLLCSTYRCLWWRAKWGRKNILMEKFQFIKGLLFSLQNMRSVLKMSKKSQHDIASVAAFQFFYIRKLSLRCLPQSQGKQNKKWAIWAPYSWISPSRWQHMVAKHGVEQISCWRISRLQRSVRSIIMYFVRTQGWWNKCRKIRQHD